MLKEAVVSVITDLAASVFGKAQGFLDKAKVVSSRMPGIQIEVQANRLQRKSEHIVS